MKRFQLFAVVTAVVGMAAAGSAQAQFGGTNASMGFSNTVMNTVQDVMQLGRVVNGRPFIDTKKIASISAIAVAESSNRMAFGMSDGSVRLWDTAAGQETYRFSPHSSSIGVMAFSGSGDVLAMLADNGAVKLLKMSTGAMTDVPGMSNGGRGLAVAREGNRVFVSFDDGSVRSWASGEALPATLYTSTSGGAYRLALNDAGTKLAVAGEKGTVHLVDVASRQAAMLADTDSDIKAVAFAREADKVLVADDDGKVRLIGPGGVEKTTSVSDDALLSIAVSHDGRFFAAGGEDKRLHVVEMATGREVGGEAGYSVPITDVTFASGDRVVVSGGTDGIAHIFDREKATAVAQVIVGKSGWIVLGSDGEFDKKGDAAIEAVKWGTDEVALDMDQFSGSHYEPGLLVRSMKSGPEEKGGVLEADMKEPELRPSLAKSFAMPPSVAFGKSLVEASVSSEDMVINLTAKDLGGGIDEIRLFQNGQVVMVDEKHRGQESPVGGDDGITVNAKTKLLKGVNEFKAVAISRERIESKPATVKLTYAPPLSAATQRAPELHVIVVGINKYKNPALNLDYGVPDATGIADFFMAQNSGLYSKVVKHALYDQQATKDNIVNLLNELSTLHVEDVAVIYLAGHGETIGTTWYFIPHDMTRPERRAEIEDKGIPSTQIDAMVQKIGARKVVLMIDACKSGAALIAVRGLEERKAIARLARATGVHIIAAAAGDQYAAELPTLGHGIFTYTVLQGLTGQASRGKTGTVTIRELTNFVEEKLPQLSEEHANSMQFPIIDSRGMDFPLAVVNAKGPPTQ